MKRSGGKKGFNKKNSKSNGNLMIKTFQKEKEESIKAVEKMHEILKDVSDVCFSEIPSKINLINILEL